MTGINLTFSSLCHIHYKHETMFLASYILSTENNNNNNNTQPKS